MNQMVSVLHVFFFSSVILLGANFQIEAPHTKDPSLSEGCLSERPVKKKKKMIELLCGSVLDRLM